MGSSFVLGQPHLVISACALRGTQQCMHGSCRPLDPSASQRHTRPPTLHAKRFGDLGRGNLPGSRLCTAASCCCGIISCTSWERHCIAHAMRTTSACLWPVCAWEQLVSSNLACTVCLAVAAKIHALVSMMVPEAKACRYLARGTLYVSIWFTSVPCLQI